jgi:hypothetical protein
MGRSRRCATATAPAQGQPDVPRQTELVICDQSIERTNSWHNAFRKLRVRYEKHPENYLGLVDLACALIVYRLCVFLG